MVKGTNMTIHWHVISPVTKPYRFKVKGIKYGYTLGERIQVTKPGNEVQALIFFIYLNHHKDPTNQTSSIKVFSYLNRYKFIKTFYHHIKNLHPLSIVYQTTRELNNSKNLQHRKDTSDPNSIKSFVINYSITRECYNIPSTASTFLRVQNIMLININYNYVEIK